MKIEFIIPFFILTVIILSSITLTYLNPQGSWVIAYYPFSTEDPLIKVAPFVDFIADSSKAKKTVTVFISTLQQKEILKKQGAILIDPEGVSLCQQS